MRKFAILTAFAALILSAGTTPAANDFDALLGEIDFGGAQETTGPLNRGQTLTMDNIPSDILAPAPAPEPLQLPVADPVASPAPQPVTISEPMMAPQTTYQPIAGPGCGCDAGTGCDGRCGSGSCGNGFCRNGSCNGRCGGRRLCGRNNNEEEYCNQCVPHTPPNLPTSSFREYFKSDACNTRVWDGWQNRCHGSSKHSRGECDCFDPREKRGCLNGLGLGGFRRNVQACNPRVFPASNCNTAGGGCLQLPAAWRIKGDCAGQAGCAVAPACDSPVCDG